MSDIFSFYPVLNENILEDSGTRVEYNFGYVKNGEVVQIPFEITHNRVFSFSKETEWNTFDYDLMCEVTIHIANCNVFYGCDAVAPLNSKIGIYLETFSQKSRKRSLTTVEGYIERTSQNQIYKCFFTVPRNTCENTIDVNVGLFLKEQANTIYENEKFLNNDKGIILGYLDNKTIFMVGNGSLFPIYINALGKNEPLWTLDVRYQEPGNEKLEDTVKIILNSDNPDFEYIDENNSGKYCSSLVDEIVADAITLLILKLQQENYLENIDAEDSSYTEGSVLDFVHYIKNTLNFDFENPIVLSKSIRKRIGGLD